MKRKALALVLAAAMAISLAACGKEETDTRREESHSSREREAEPEEVIAPKVTEETASPKGDEEDAKASELNQASFQIATAYPFSEDRAWVDYFDSDNNVTYTALIDTEGDVLYKTENPSRFIPSPMEGGVSVIYADSDYRFIDASGREVGSISDEDGKVKILGWYNGSFLIKEEKTGFSENTWEYYLVDKNGQKSSEPIVSISGIGTEVFMCEDYGYESNMYFGYNLEYGQNLISEFGHFIIGYYSGSDAQLTMVDVSMSDGNATTYRRCCKYVGSFKTCAEGMYDTTGGIYVEWKRSSDTRYIPLREMGEGGRFYDLDEISNLRDYGEGNHIVTTDGKVIVVDNRDRTSFSVYDIASGEPIAEGLDLGGSISGWRPSYDGQYIAVILEGADGERYVTVLDKDLHQMYEPQPAGNISGDSYVYNGYVVDYEGRIAYTPDGQPISLQGDDWSGIGREASLVSEYNNRWILSGGFINNSIANNEPGYRSLDGKTIITEVTVTE